MVLNNFSLHSLHWGESHEPLYTINLRPNDNFLGPQAKLDDITKFLRLLPIVHPAIRHYSTPSLFG